jgi:hypothetical protein
MIEPLKRNTIYSQEFILSKLLWILIVDTRKITMSISQYMLTTHASFNLQIINKHPLLREKGSNGLGNKLGMKDLGTV